MRTGEDRDLHHRAVTAGFRIAYDLGRLSPRALGAKAVRRKVSHTSWTKLIKRNSRRPPRGSFWGARCGLTRASCPSRPQAPVRVPLTSGACSPSGVSPMGDYRRVLRVRQCFDSVESVLVVERSHSGAGADVHPQEDEEEPFDHSICIGSVLPDSPGGGAGPAATEPPCFQRGNHLFGVSFNCVILHTYQHRTNGGGIRRQFGLGPIARRSQSLGESAGTGSADRREDQAPTSAPAMRNVGERPRCLAVMPSTALPTALPPWKTMR